MTETPIVAIRGLGLWMDGYPSVPAWSLRIPDPDADKPTGKAFDRINRRRAGKMGRAIADAAAEAMEQAVVDTSSISTVVGSSIGEATTMIGLLEQMWREKTPMSPAAFTVSVHNAASGLLSISNKNTGFTTSLAADEDTPGVAMLEAIGLVLDRGLPALVVCADEAAPLKLLKDAPNWDLIAGAIVLAPLEKDSPHLARVRVLCGQEATLPEADLTQNLVHNPQAGILNMIDAVLQGATGSVRLDRNTGCGYAAELDFAGTR